MYQVTASTNNELLSDSPRHERVVLWDLGGEEDISARIIEGGISDASASVGPFLSGYRSAPMSILLDNTDRHFSPLTSGSRLDNPPDAKTYNTKVTVKERITGASGVTEDVPIATGLVKYLRLGGGVLELRIDDTMTSLLQTPLPEEVTLDHGQATTTTNPAQIIKNLLDDFSTIDSTADVDSPSYLRCLGVLNSLNWPTTGVIPARTTIGDAINALARSGMFTVYPDLVGKLHFHHEFPKVTSTFRQPAQVVPELFDNSNSWGHDYQRGLTSNVTEVTVRYRGVSGTYRDKTDETTLGRQTQFVDMPFLAFYRQARWCARFLHEIFGGVFDDIVTFSTGPRGMLIELNDRVRVEDSENGVEQTYRVMSKSWDGQVASFTGMKLGHETTIVDGDFSQWNVDTWGVKAVL